MEPTGGGRGWLKSMEPTGGGRGWLKSMEPTGGGEWEWYVHVMYSVLEPATPKLAIRLHNRTGRDHRRSGHVFGQSVV